MIEINVSNIRNFLRDPKNVRRMLAAADNGRPPVEPLQDDLLATFGQGVRVYWVKQRIGRETKYVMAGHGYRHVKYGVTVVGPVFKVASVYENVR